MYESTAKSVNSYVKNPIKPIKNELVAENTWVCLQNPVNIDTTRKQIDLDLLNGKTMVKNTYKKTREQTAR